jgi:uncharacterized protein YbbK (DUF523 family)
MIEKLRASHMKFFTNPSGKSGFYEPININININNSYMDNVSAKSVFLVSACLMGLCARYDGTVKPDAKCKEFLKETLWIPVCPEQLGGLPTPRPAADIIDGTGYDVLEGSAAVCTREGDDVTAQFIQGAKQVLQIAQSHEIQGICLKARSPSCAVSGIIGVTAALLNSHGFKLYEF